MFEKEIKFISDFTINKIKDLGSYFTYNELFNTDINLAILKFISAQVDYRIFKDREKLLNQSSFDYSGSEIAGYFDLIAKEIKKSTKISYDDIKDVVNQAIAFNTDYTITPNEALKNLFFDKKQERKIEDIRLMLNYVYYYPYVKDILTSYLNKKKISVLSSSVFAAIFSEIDKKLFESEPEKIIEDVINTLSDYYNIGSLDKRKLSIQLVVAFLKEKNLEKYLKRLNANVPLGSKQKFDIDDIKDFLFTAPSHEEKDENQKEMTEEKNVKVLSGKDLEQSDQKEVEFDITEHGNLDALYSFDEGDTEEGNIEQEKALKNAQEKIKEELQISDKFKAKENENAPIIKKENKDLNGELINEEAEQKKEVNKKPKQKDIFSYLTDKEIEKIVGYIFNDDRDEFASTMEKISESDTYEEATEILKSVFKNYNVNPYSKDAITFTNSVSNYFEQV